MAPPFKTNRSNCQRVRNDIDAKLGVVFGQEAFIPKIVIPLAAIVFIAVQYADTSVDGYGFQVIMHKVVAPAVEFKTGGGWAIGKLEKGGVNGMVVRDFLQRLRSERLINFLLERLGKQPVDVVIAVVHEHEPAVLHVAFELIALVLRKLHQLVPAEVAERTFKQIGTIQPHYPLFLIDGQRGVFHERMQQIARHPLIGIPVAGGVLNAGKNERFQG